MYVQKCIIKEILVFCVTDTCLFHIVCEFERIFLQKEKQDQFQFSLICATDAIELLCIVSEELLRK